MPPYRAVQRKVQDGQRYQQEEGIPWPVLVDDLEGTVHQAYGGLADPTYLIDSDGRVAYYNMWTHVPTLYRAVEELLRQGGRGVVRGGINRLPHLLPSMTDGWKGLRRGLPQSLIDIETAGPGTGIGPWLGYQMRPLLAPLTLRAKPLPTSVRIALAVGAAAVVVMAARQRPRAGRRGGAPTQWIKGPDWNIESPPSTLLAGAAAGLAGGLVGAWTMNQAPPAITSLGKKAQGVRRQIVVGDGPQRDSAATQDDAPRRHGGEEESSAVTVARKVWRTIAGRDLPPGTESAAGNAVHFGFGAFVGAVYGALAKLVPGVTAGRGTVWGAIVWVVADETAQPLLGLSKGPRAYPLTRHALSLMAHLVYGATADLVRRALQPVASSR